ncbi:hypothetical protein BKA57DRAFT_193386 [Linnemannia elongata]|nr:hypothetical protein BKA57DRAFT_193386 [Linnemannia elongata]
MRTFSFSQCIESLRSQLLFVCLFVCCCVLLGHACDKQTLTTFALHACSQSSQPPNSLQSMLSEHKACIMVEHIVCEAMPIAPLPSLLSTISLFFFSSLIRSLLLLTPPRPLLFLPPNPQSPFSSSPCNISILTPESLFPLSLYSLSLLNFGCSVECCGVPFGVFCKERKGRGE